MWSYVQGDVVSVVDHRFDCCDLRSRGVAHKGIYKDSPVGLGSRMSKTLTTGHFFEKAESFRRSSGDRKIAVELDAMGNEFMAKAIELDTKQQKLARGT